MEYQYDTSKDNSVKIEHLQGILRDKVNFASTMPNIPENMRSSAERTIATTMVEVSDILGVDIPPIELMDEEEGKARNEIGFSTEFHGDATNPHPIMKINPIGLQE